IKRVCYGYPITPLIFIGFALWSTVWSIRSQPVPTLAALGTLLLAYAAHAVTMRTRRTAINGTGPGQRT
ncbi:MAG TPA: hypothetical protein VLR92_09695, partial [Blastocatellia bacterium]|nr:hypothetical protein [Blastocatellia bacterium]